MLFLNFIERDRGWDVKKGKLNEWIGVRIRVCRVSFLLWWRGWESERVWVFSRRQRKGREFQFSFWFWTVLAISHGGPLSIIHYSRFSTLLPLTHSHQTLLWPTRSSHWPVPKWWSTRGYSSVGYFLFLLLLCGSDGGNKWRVLTWSNISCPC